MKTKNYDGTDMRKVLTGMVLDRTVCGRVASVWPEAGEGLFASSWANIAGGMIVRYYRQYGEPPTHQMHSLFEEWSKSTTVPDEEITAVERFLRGVSDEGHQDAPEYIIDLAGRHFNKVVMDRDLSQVQADLAEWQIDRAHEKLDAMRRINLGSNSHIEPTKDRSLWADAFSEERTRPLVRYNMALHDFFGDAFQRGRLFSFMASDKVGKTTWMIDFVFRALKQFNHVAFFDAGDAGQSEFLRRLACRLTGLPLREGLYDLPVSWEDEQLVSQERYLQAVDPADAFREINKISSPGALRASFHDSGTLSAASLDSILSVWDNEDDYRPDCIVLDYADLLAPPKGIKDPLDQIDETWKRLRRISQQRHCLVITATQASALAYAKDGALLTKKHFSGRKTKLAHVNGIFGINVSSEEKENGTSRINWIVRREGAYNEKHSVRVAGCMAIGNPAILSKKWTPKTDKTDE